jgi:hypothetical protein
MSSAPGASSGKVNEARAERAAVGGVDNQHPEEAGAAASKDQVGRAAAPNRRAAMAPSHRRAAKAAVSLRETARTPASPSLGP